MRTYSETVSGTTGEPLFYRAWLPDGQPRASVVLVHGLSEHSERYDHVGRFLAARGVAVYAHDHLGH
jgi:alpha-beta hydrolase superfamily lysophospholipase